MQVVHAQGQLFLVGLRPHTGFQSWLPPLSSWAPLKTLLPFCAPISSSVKQDCLGNLSQDRCTGQESKLCAWLGGPLVLGSLVLGKGALALVVQGRRQEPQP